MNFNKHVHSKDYKLKISPGHLANILCNSANVLCAGDWDLFYAFVTLLKHWKVSNVASCFGLGLMDNSLGNWHCNNFQPGERGNLGVNVVKHVAIMEHVKGWDTASIQFQQMEVENVEDLVQKQNHATENYAQVIVFFHLLPSSLCKS